jgi:hypothetical protein
VVRPSDDALVLERFVRGDMQTLSRHAIGVTGSDEVSPEIMYAGPSRVILILIETPLLASTTNRC